METCSPSFFASLWDYFYVVTCLLYLYIKREVFMSCSKVLRILGNHNKFTLANFDYTFYGIRFTIHA